MVNKFVELNKAVQRGRESLASVTAKRDEVEAKLTAKRAEAEAQRGGIGAALVAGGDPEKLSTELRHKESEIAALKAAHQVAVATVADVARAKAEAERDLALAECDDLHAQMKKAAKDAVKIYDKLEAQGEKIMDLRQQADAAFERNPLKQRDTRFIYEHRLNNHAQTGHMILDNVNQYRALVENIENF